MGDATILCIARMSDACVFKNDYTDAANKQIVYIPSSISTEC